MSDLRKASRVSMDRQPGQGSRSARGVLDVLADVLLAQQHGSSFNYRPQLCTRCGALMKRCCGYQHNQRAPAPGDISACGNCGRSYLLVSDGWRPTTEVEQLALPQNVRGALAELEASLAFAALLRSSPRRRLH